MINPDECIDCALCEPECPANAIFSEDELPEGQEVFIELNAELSQNGLTLLKLAINQLTVKNGTVNLINYNILKVISKDQQSLIFLYQTFHCKFLVICALFCIKIAAIFISA